MFLHVLCRDHEEYENAKISRSSQLVNFMFFFLQDQLSKFEVAFFAFQSDFQPWWQIIYMKVPRLVYFYSKSTYADIFLSSEKRS